MPLTQAQATIAFEKAVLDCNTFNIKFRTKDLNVFKETLRSIAEASPYQEGQPIQDDHLELISQQASVLLDATADQLIKDHNINDKATPFNPLARMITASDYLYTLAMKALGCPDIPVAFGEIGQKKVESSALKIHQTVVKYDMNRKTSFQAQRGKNADVMRKEGVDTLIQDVRGKRYTSRQVGNLIAEYQALKDRQARHGAIWRFFHSSENELRNNLLKEMNDTLKGLIGNHFDPDKANPAEYARKFADVKIQGTLDRELGDRMISPEKAFGLESEIDVRQNLNDVEKFSLFSDVNPEPQKSEIKPQKMKDKIDPPSNDFSIL